MMIDANNLILGRIATISAKKALMGERVDIINCEKAVITGSRREVLEKFKRRVKRGIPSKGPYYPKRADMLVRRSIRGMLPYKQEKGRKAFKRIRCYIGHPEKFKDKKIETVKKADFSKIPVLRYVRVGELCKEIGKNDLN